MSPIGMCTFSSSARTAGFSSRNAELATGRMSLAGPPRLHGCSPRQPVRFSTTVRSEGHTSELQSLMRISYAVFRLTKKKKNRVNIHGLLHTARCRMESHKLHVHT